MTAGTAEVVITTKLFRPGLRHQTVERKRLYDLLREGRTLPLTLVVAPAGWGKSTIVADWLARDDVTAGWVSLDGGDNDPQRFWRYLLLAAGQAGSAAGAPRCGGWTRPAPTCCATCSPRSSTSWRRPRLR